MQGHFLLCIRAHAALDVFTSSSAHSHSELACATHAQSAIAQQCKSDRHAGTTTQCSTCALHNQYERSDSHSDL
jgi:hypothetical protein